MATGIGLNLLYYTDLFFYGLLTLPGVLRKHSCDPGSGHLTSLWDTFVDLHKLSGSTDEDYWPSEKKGKAHFMAATA